MRVTHHPSRARGAASPVVGVVMLVAITVILSAVVGALALGMGGGVDANVNAAVDVRADPTTHRLDVTLVSEHSADHVVVTMTSDDAVAEAELTAAGGRVVASADGGVRTTGAAETVGCGWRARGTPPPHAAGDGVANAGNGNGNNGNAGNGNGNNGNAGNGNGNNGNAGAGNGNDGNNGGGCGPPNNGNDGNNGNNGNRDAQAAHAPSAGDEVEIVVKAVKGGRESVIYTGTETI